MTKVLFTHPYFLALDPKQADAGLPYPPLGPLYAAALARKEGYQVAFFDSMFARSGEDVRNPLESNRPDVLVVYADGFNYLTKMCLTNMREATFRMIRIARESGCSVIVSSSDSTDHMQAYLEAGADFIINGEAEWTLMELLESAALGPGQRAPLGVDDRAGIKGLAYLDASGAVHSTPRRPVIKDWSILPFPAFDLVDMERYRSTWIKHKGYFSLNMATTRGCPFHCNWCAKPIYGNRYTARPAEQVVRDLKQMQERYHFDHIWFCDDIFGLKPGWVRAFADSVQREGLSFTYKIQSRADLLVEENTIRDLAGSGCESVWMGAESGSQKILDAMEKGTTVGQIEQATRLLHENGIKPCFFIQFGYLGETKEDIGLTVQLIRKLRPADIGISVSYPLPGTGFYEKVKSSLGPKSNWTDSDELALMFRNTYSPAYYKQLYRYVHRIHRQNLALHYLAGWWRSLTSQWRASESQASQGPGAKITGSVLKKIASVCYYLPAARLARIKLEQLEQAV